MAKRRRGVGPSNSFGYQGSFGNPPRGPAKGTNYNPGTPGGPGLAPGSNAQGLPPAVGGRPLDPQELAYQTAANRGFQLGKGEAAYQRGQLDQEYGYGDSGAANPYSRAALLEESYRRSKLGTTNSMASAGQLHSGAYGSAQNENSRRYSIASDANRREYDRAQHDINYGLAQQGSQYGVGMDDEAYQALLRALGLA